MDSVGCKKPSQTEALQYFRIDKPDKGRAYYFFVL